eukprot:gnl/MRDRNA2_/MRDRNA2_108803_c0_seq1.p1 gnl/MRDRNA2_/MRDRNA2_108803_c0~~gnl/MRDRNA2_/MRDRNA2_108803_c0_seq1.p1  ORF type:complete len:297 (-),score=69.94 gnl/MRDRNA2_/MRDRNA2_108803_c0_seq1:21-911(-)
MGDRSWFKAGIALIIGSCFVLLCVMAMTAFQSSKSAATSTNLAASMKVPGILGKKMKPKLHVDGVFMGFKRSKVNQYANFALLRVNGVNTREEANWYLGKKVVFPYMAKKKLKHGSLKRRIWGKIVKTHGHRGVVRAKFKKNLPPSGMAKPVHIMLYPNRQFYEQTKRDEYEDLIESSLKTAELYKKNLTNPAHVAMIDRAIEIVTNKNPTPNGLKRLRAPVGTPAINWWEHKDPWEIYREKKQEEWEEKQKIKEEKEKERQANKKKKEEKKAAIIARIAEQRAGGADAKRKKPTP